MACQPKCPCLCRSFSNRGGDADDACGIVPQLHLHAACCMDWQGHKVGMQTDGLHAKESEVSQPWVST